MQAPQRALVSGAFYVFYAWWIYFPQLGALTGMGPSRLLGACAGMLGLLTCWGLLLECWSG
jgi:hypothetical protein